MSRGNQRRTRARTLAASQPSKGARSSSTSLFLRLGADLEGEVISFLSYKDTCWLSMTCRPLLSREHMGERGRLRSQRHAYTNHITITTMRTALAWRGRG